MADVVIGSWAEEEEGGDEGGLDGVLCCRAGWWWSTMARLGAMLGQRIAHTNGWELNLPS